MFDYFCEGRSSVYVVLALAGLGLLVLWWQTRKRSFLLALAAVALLAGLHFLLDRFVETDHEQVIRKLQEMAAGVKSRNVNAILTHVSDRFQADTQGVGSMDKAQLRGYIEMVFQHRLVDDLSVWDFRFPPSDPAPPNPDSVSRSDILYVEFFAKPTGGFAANTPHFLCKAHFVREAGNQWRLHDFQYFNPFIDTNRPLSLPRM